MKIKGEIKKGQVIVIKKAQNPEVLRCGCLSSPVSCDNPIVQAY